MVLRGGTGEGELEVCEGDSLLGRLLGIPAGSLTFAYRTYTMAIVHLQRELSVGYSV